MFTFSLLTDKKTVREKLISAISFGCKIAGRLKYIHMFMHKEKNVRSSPISESMEPMM